MFIRIFLALCIQFKCWSLFFLFSSFAYVNALAFTMSEGDAGILINAETGVILFQKEAKKPLFPASTTKIATALYALNLLHNNLTASVTVEAESLKTVTDAYKSKLNYQMPGYWLEPDGTHISLKSGEIITFQALLEGLLISSGNDAANVIAHALGPTIPLFIENLNQFLKTIGCLNTEYYNPHGLHHPKHVTTAYDLAQMTAIALRNIKFREIVSKAKFIRPKTNLQASMTLLQGNRLLRPGKFFYAKAIGVKTGYHSRAKKTFVGAAQHEGRTLIVVLLGYKNKGIIFEDAVKLFELAFNQKKMEKIYITAGPQTFTLPLKQAKNSLKTYTKENLSLIYYPAEEQQYDCCLKWYPLELPIVKDQVVGELQLISASGIVTQKVDLKATEAVREAWPYHWLSNLKRFYQAHSYISLIYLFGFAASLIYSFKLYFYKKS